MAGGMSTKAALAIAKLRYKTPLEDSEKAIVAGKAKVVTPALENNIETNILLSGPGFESSGLAAAHAIHDGLTQIEEIHHCYHGWKVAFDKRVHLVLENARRRKLTPCSTIACVSACRCVSRISVSAKSIRSG